MAGKNKQFINSDNRLSLKKMLSNNIALVKFIYVAIALNIFNMAFVLLMQNNLPPQVPLLYGFAEGEQQLTSPQGLLLPGGFSMTLVLINSALSIIVDNEFLKKTLTITAFTVSFLSLITVTKIIFLVGYF